MLVCSRCQLLKESGHDNIEVRGATTIREGNALCFSCVRFAEDWDYKTWKLDLERKRAEFYTVVVLLFLILIATILK